ncbi:hypothetical protein RFW18_12095 [Metabacillus idriensis]|nr:hypothetical protein [Metabacillus idriensis]MDR0138486.1 hypothetical protein [Metabacillus idriensis]
MTNTCPTSHNDENHFNAQMQEMNIDEAMNRNSKSSNDKQRVKSAG